MEINSRIEMKNFNVQSTESWKLNMEDVPLHREQWVVVDPSTKPTSMLKEDWEKLEIRPRSTILFTS
jgi:hypothetical protein